MQFPRAVTLTFLYGTAGRPGRVRIVCRNPPYQFPSPLDMHSSICLTLVMIGEWAACMYMLLVELPERNHDKAGTDCFTYPGLGNYQ